MASSYGFRVYAVQVFPNRIKDKDPLDLIKSGATRNRIVELLEELADGGTEYIEPAVPAQPGHPPKATTSITVGIPALVRDDVVHLEVSTGAFGAHRAAVAPGEADVPLSDRSAEVPHFVTFVFPKTSQDTMLVVGQVYGVSDPVARLLARMQQVSAQQKKAATLAQDEERAALKAAGEKVPTKKAFDRLLFDRRQAADPGYLDRIIAEAKKVRVLFERVVPNDRGPGTRVQRSMQVFLVEDREREAGKRPALEWMRRQRAGDEPTAQEGVDELAEALRDEDLIEDSEEEPYNQAAINLTGTEGRTNITTSTLREVFTYRVSEGRPPVVYYYEKVAERLKVIAAEESVEVDPIDPVEVDQCLEDSISDPS